MDAKGNALRIRNKVALVTGAGSGIGRATAILLAQEGARVIVADLNQSSGKGVVATIRQHGGEATFVRVDVSQEEDVKRMVSIAVETYGRIDILVNNAGILLTGTVVDLSEDEWDRLIAVNLKGVFLCSKHVIPVMRAGGGGAIVNIASTQGLVGVRNGAGYCASKGGVVALTRAMALDHIADNIRVNCVCPGAVDTPLLRNISSPEDLEKISREVPIGRLAAPEEIASVVLYLASSETSFVTGAVWTVDGGSTAE